MNVASRENVDSTMRKLILVAIVASLTMLLTAGLCPAEKPKIGSSHLSIAAFGDSTTAPRESLAVYCDILGKTLPEKGLDVDVINSGVPSNTTAQALSRLQQDVLRYGPSLAIIQFGINDSTVDVWKNPPVDKPRVSPEDYRKNLRQMIKAIKNCDAKVILMTPNPLAWTEELRKLYGKPPYDPADEDGLNVLLKQYVEIVKQVGKEEGVPVLDVFAAFRSQKDCKAADLLLDGMHPNARGHQLTADLLLKQIDEIKDKIKPTIYGERIHAKAQELPHSLLGPFVKLADGTVLAPDEQCLQVSRDGGRTWTQRPVFADEKKFKMSGERAFIQTKKGTLIIAFMNMPEICFKWDDTKGGPQPGCRLPAYVVRSTDGGKTWLAPQQIQDGWCGAVRSMLQTSKGRIVAAVEQGLANPGRHVMYGYVSDDEGATWKRSDAIDIGKPGGYGDHGGTMEGTMVELADGRIYQLLRTVTGRFWETFSDDGGLTWQKPQPSQIMSGSSPAILERLESGRIVILWNRFRDPEQRFGRRDTLYMAFSVDECKSWLEATAVASNIMPAGQTEVPYRQSYPYVFEFEPGVLWITTMQGAVRMSLREEDFVK